MQIVVYTSPDWPMPSGFVPDGGDQVQLLSGELDTLADQVVSLQPDVLLVAGFADAPSLLMSLERACQMLVHSAVLTVYPTPEPDFLMRLMQIGVREVLTGEPAQWVGAINRVRARSRSLQQGGAPAFASTRIGFLSAKGGDGSTSVAVNMAAALASDTLNRVLLIDLALPFGDADISIWNKIPEHDLADFCSEVHRLDDALLASMVAQIKPNLHFMASPAVFEKVIGIDPAAVQHLLEFLSSRYSFILIDVGSHVDPLTLRVWEQLDQVVVVASASVPSLRRLNRLRQLWESLGLSVARLNVVINRLSAKPDVELTSFERVCPGKFLRQLPVEAEAMKASVMQGVPLVELQPRSAYARTVAAWAAEWSGRPQKEKSLWQRLRKK